MSMATPLKLEKTYLFAKNDVFIRYEVYLDQMAHPHNVVLILVIQEDDKSRVIVDRLTPNEGLRQLTGFQQNVGQYNPGPLQVAMCDQYCSKHFSKNYS